jgi:hypothetical protein
VLVATAGCETVLGLGTNGGSAEENSQNASQPCEGGATPDAKSLDALSSDLDAADRDATAGEAGGGVLIINADLPVPVGYWPLDGAYEDTPHRMVARIGPDALVARDDSQTAVKGQVGNAYQLQGSSQVREALIVPPRVDDPLELTTAGTISVWFSFDSLPAGAPGQHFMALVDKGGFATDLGIAATAGMLANTTQIGFGLGQDGTNGTGMIITASAHFETGDWHHVVATFEANNDVCLYLDRGDKPSCTGIRASRTADVQPLKFGEGSYWTERTFVGRLDEIAIWNVALSQPQVSALHALGLAGMPLIGN